MYPPSNEYIPQIGSSNRPLLMWLVVATGSLGVMAIIIGAPLAQASGHNTLAATIYLVFSHLCHQLPERSFFIDGHPFAVCARCTGIYAGFAMATFIYPLVKSLRQTETPARKWLFIAAALLAADVVFDFTGLGHNTHSSRLLTGALLGGVAVFYVMPGLLELSLRPRNRGLENESDQEVNHGENASPAEVFSAQTSGVPSDYSAPHRRI